MNEVESQIEQKQCGNCDQMIDKSKFMIHEAYCIRHLYKCECGEIVCKAEREDHEEEKHVSVACKHCGYEAMKHIFANHEET